MCVETRVATIEFLFDDAIDELFTVNFSLRFVTVRSRLSRLRGVHSRVAKYLWFLYRFDANLIELSISPSYAG